MKILFTNIKKIFNWRKKKILCVCQTDNEFGSSSPVAFIWKTFHSKLFSTSHHYINRESASKSFWDLRLLKWFESSDISNSVYESQKLTIFFCIWKGDLCNELITRLSEQGTPRPRTPLHHLVSVRNTSTSDASEASVSLYCQLE